MPRYEYRCRVCDATFERSRPFHESADPAPCPSGHADTVKLLSTVATITSGRGGDPAPVGAGGGCCGGACGCGH